VERKRPTKGSSYRHLSNNSSKESFLLQKEVFQVYQYALLSLIKSSLGLLKMIHILSARTEGKRQCKKDYVGKM
jgi:hypothetical protein